MDRLEAFENILRSYERYYDIKRENPMPPFAAEASFETHSEGFMLIRAAKLAEFDAREYVFFAVPPRVDTTLAEELADKVWEETLRRAIPQEGHKSTDGVLVILTDELDKGAAAHLRRERRFQSYRHGIYGSSTLRIVARDLSKEETVTNRHGRDLARLFRDR